MNNILLSTCISIPPPLPLPTTTINNTSANPPRTSIAATNSTPSAPNATQSLEVSTTNNSQIANNSTHTSWAHHNMNLLAATAANSHHTITTAPTPAAPHNSNNINNLQYQQHLHPAHHLHHHSFQTPHYPQPTDHRTTNRTGLTGSNFNNNNNINPTSLPQSIANNSYLNSSVFDLNSMQLPISCFSSGLPISEGTTNFNNNTNNNNNLHSSSQQLFLNQRTNIGGSPFPQSSQQATHSTNSANTNNNNNNCNHQPVVSSTSTSSHTGGTPAPTTQSSLFSSGVSPMTHQPHAYAYNPSPSIPGAPPYHISRPAPLTKPPPSSQPPIPTTSHSLPSPRSLNTTSTTSLTTNSVNSHHQQQSYSTAGGGPIHHQQQTYQHHNNSKPSPGQYSPLSLPITPNHHSSSSNPTSWSPNIMSYPPIGSSSANQAHHHHHHMMNMTTTTTTPTLRTPLAAVTTSSQSSIPTSSFHNNNNSSSNNTGNTSSNYPDMHQINRFALSQLVSNSSQESNNFHLQQSQHSLSHHPPLPPPPPSHASSTGSNNKMRPPPPPPPSHSPQMMNLLDIKQHSSKIMNAMCLQTTEQQRAMQGLFRHQFPPLQQSTHSQSPQCLSHPKDKQSPSNMMINPTGCNLGDSRQNHSPQSSFQQPPAAHQSSKTSSGIHAAHYYEPSHKTNDFHQQQSQHLLNPHPPPPPPPSHPSSIGMHNKMPPPPHSPHIMSPLDIRQHSPKNPNAMCLQTEQQRMLIRQHFTSLQQSPHSQLSHLPPLLSHPKEKQSSSMMNLSGCNIGDSRQNHSPQSNFQQPPAAHQSSKTSSGIHAANYYKPSHEPNNFQQHQSQHPMNLHPPPPVPSHSSPISALGKMPPPPHSPQILNPLDIRQHSPKIMNAMCPQAADTQPNNMSTYEFLVQKKATDEQSRLQNANSNNRTRAHTPNTSRVHEQEQRKPRRQHHTTIQHMTHPPTTDLVNLNSTHSNKTVKSETIISTRDEKGQMPKTECNNKQVVGHSVNSSLSPIASTNATLDDSKFGLTSLVSNDKVADSMAPPIVSQSSITFNVGNSNIASHENTSNSKKSLQNNAESIASNLGSCIKQEVQDQQKDIIKIEDNKGPSSLPSADHYKATIPLAAITPTIEPAPATSPVQAPLSTVISAPVPLQAPASTSAPPAPPVVNAGSNSSNYSSAACKKKQWINRYHQEDDSNSSVQISTTTNQHADSKANITKPIGNSASATAQIKKEKNQDMAIKVKTETSKSTKTSCKGAENDQARVSAKPLGGKKQDTSKVLKATKETTTSNKRVKTEMNVPIDNGSTTSSASDSDSSLKPPEKKARRMPTRRITNRTNTSAADSNAKSVNISESNVKPKSSRTRNRDRLDEIRRRLKSTSGTVLPPAKPLSKRLSIANQKRQTRAQQVTKDESNQETDDSVADHSTDIEEEDASSTTTTGSKSNAKSSTNKAAASSKQSDPSCKSTNKSARASDNDNTTSTSSSKKKFKSEKNKSDSTANVSNNNLASKVSNSTTNGQNQGSNESEARRTMAIHKRNGETFLQKQSCVDVDPDIKVPRCLECRQTRHSNNQKSDRSQSSKQRTNWFCRFYEFRKLKYKTPTQLVTAGFSEPNDADNTDELIWSLKTDPVPPNMNEKMAKFIVDHVGDQFCDIVMQERDAKTLYSRHRDGNLKPIIWKRAVNGVREMCDVCATTLFNRHFGCEKCGFVVCIDCYKTKALHPSTCENVTSVSSPDPTDATLAISTQPDKDNSESLNRNEEKDTDHPTVVPTVVQSKNRRDNFNWISCAKNKFHSHRNLVLIQIIAGDSLDKIWNVLHKVRASWSPKSNCKCDQGRENQEPDSQARLLISLPVANRQELSTVQADNRTIKKSQSHQQILSDDDTTDHSTLRGLLLDQLPPAITQTNSSTTTILQPTTNQVSSSPELTTQSTIDNNSPKKDADNIKQEKISCVANKLVIDDNFIIKSDSVHTWCDNELLVLLQPRHKENLRLFRAQWKLGKPILVRGMDKLTNMDLWLPQYFSEKFGFYRNDLIDCRHDSIHKHSMKKYWDNFEQHYGQKKTKKNNNSSAAANSDDNSASNSSISNSATNATPDSYPLWKMKDWPPSEDFGEILPDHYKDYMDNLPLSTYTTRNGQLNLACRIPNEMLKPDLGPKLYSAYGTTKFSHKGTTNLHLDVSDAINVMMYVGGAKAFEEGSVEQEEYYNDIINQCDVDLGMKNIIRKNKGCPGALWHVFKQSDVVALRTFLNKIAEERNINPNLRSDPIHDQIWYLDAALRKRLFDEYGVKPFSILQCMGDAIIIPAGAPHQVKNLNSCIKVATDFVSPENVDQCFQLTREFRKLPDTHINHEDKLQIKNIVYHAIKDSLSYLQKLEPMGFNDSATDEDDSVPLDGSSSPVNGGKVVASSPSPDKEKKRAKKKLALNGSKTN